jgi:hypothetical protein
MSAAFAFGLFGGALFYCAVYFTALVFLKRSNRLVKSCMDFGDE